MAQRTPQSIDIELDIPIQIEGRDVTAITVRRPQASDAVKAKYRRLARSQDSDLVLVAGLCSFNGRPLIPEHLHELDEFDARKIADQIDEFLI